MKVSFIIPVYNCGQYLNKFIREIEAVGLHNYEIILVNDGSTDDSGNVCDEIAKENEKICCIHQKNQGVSSARNHGLQAASGDYVCFFDADDDIESEKLYELLRSIEKEKTVIDIAFFGMAFDYYYKGKMYRRDEMMTPLQGIQDEKKWNQRLEDLFYSNSLSPIWNKVFRREFLIKYGLYFSKDMFIYEDLEYSLRCMSDCRNILFVPEIIYYYRQSEDEGNAGRRLKRIEHISEVVARIEKAANELKTRSEKEKQGLTNILLSLYLVLAKEKIAVSNARQIKQICDDFSDWFENRNIEIPSDHQNFVELLLKRNVCRLILRRKYISIRHRIAVAAKNTRIYQKLRG